MHKLKMVGGDAPIDSLNSLFRKNTTEKNLHAPSYHFNQLHNFPESSLIFLESSAAVSPIPVSWKYLQILQKQVDIR